MLVGVRLQLGVEVLQVYAPSVESGTLDNPALEWALFDSGRVAAGAAMGRLGYGAPRVGVCSGRRKTLVGNALFREETFSTGVSSLVATTKRGRGCTRSLYFRQVSFKSQFSLGISEARVCNISRFCTQEAAPIGKCHALHNHYIFAL
jgi:hypothetical protein